MDCGSGLMAATFAAERYGSASTNPNFGANAGSFKTDCGSADMLTGSGLTIGVPVEETDAG
jgi:hypothetical protein